MPKRRLIALACAAFAISGPAFADPLPAVRSEQGDARVHVEMLDITPSFLSFYAAARNVDDPAVRFALWQRHYGFAAVPPGPRGDAMARGLLERGWPRYAAALPLIHRGAAVFGTQPIDTLRAVAALLEADYPIAIRFRVYVGAFEDNAFGSGGEPPMVNFPVEMSDTMRPLILAHEITHAVHTRVAGLSGGWERSIGATLMQEGLAVHVARELHPGLAMAQYIEHRPGWWASVAARKHEVLRDVRSVLTRQDGETVFRYTIGEGPSGLEREAYAAGWWVIEHLRSHGMTLAQIARIRESDMPGVAGRAIDEMLAERS